MKTIVMSFLYAGLIFTYAVCAANAQGVPAFAKAVRALSKPTAWHIISELALNTPAARGMTTAKLASQWQHSGRFQTHLWDDLRTYYPNVLINMLNSSPELTSREVIELMTQPTMHEMNIPDSLAEKIDRVALQAAQAGPPTASPPPGSVGPKDFVTRINRVLEKRSPDCSIEMCAGYGTVITASFGAGCGDFAGTVTTSGKFSISGAQNKTIVFQMHEDK